MVIHVFAIIFLMLKSSFESHWLIFTPLNDIFVYAIVIFFFHILPLIFSPFRLDYCYWVIFQIIYLFLDNFFTW